MADKNKDFEALFGKPEDEKTKKMKTAPAPKQEKKGGFAGGMLYFLFVISVSVILACLAWAAATDVLGFKSSDTVAQITLEKDSFTYKEVEVTDDEGNTKTKKVHYADAKQKCDL